MFVKLQGTGRVRVTVTRGAGYEELAAVEFLDDVTLRFSEDMFRHRPGQDTHEVVIKKGSVLRLIP